MADDWPVQGGSELTKKQLSRLFAIAHASGWSRDQLLRQIDFTFGKTSPDQLSWAEYSGLCTYLLENPLERKGETMPIARNAGDAGNFIKEPGEYVVKVHKIETGMSKSNKPMLTVTFHTRDERAIRGYFVRTLTFHMKALEALKIACGLKVTDPAEQLLGKECGILVEAQEPDANGRTFMSITGYGKASEVTTGSDFAQTTGADNVPF